jgi:hypothetical protein
MIPYLMLIVKVNQDGVLACSEKYLFVPVIKKQVKKAKTWPFQSKVFSEA